MDTTNIQKTKTMNEQTTTPELLTLKAKRVKTKYGMTTEIYNDRDEKVATYPPYLKQPRKGSKAIVHNCFTYKLEWI
jgi:hypothetical protein